MSTHMEFAYDIESNNGFQLKEIDDIMKDICDKVDDVCKVCKTSNCEFPKCSFGPSKHCRHECPYYKYQAACHICVDLDIDLYWCDRCSESHCLHKCPYGWQVHRLCDMCVKCDAAEWKICECPKTREGQYHCIHKCIKGESDSGWLSYFHRENCWCQRCIQNETYHGAYADELSELHTLCYDCVNAPSDHWQCDMCPVASVRHCPHHCPLMRSRFGNTALTLFVVGLILYIVNTGSDVALAIKYFTTGHYKWGALTSACVILPGVAMSVYSMSVWISDGLIKFSSIPEKVKTCLFTLSCLLLITPMAWTLLMIHNVWFWKFRKHVYTKKGTDFVEGFTKDYDRYKNIMKRIQLVEVYLENAPQIMLQLYIVLQTGQPEASVKFIQQMFSITSSWFSISWSLVAFYVSVHPNVKFGHFKKLVILLWQLFVIGPRMLALGLFSITYSWGVFIICAIHCTLIWVYFFRNAVKGNKRG